MTHVVLFSGFGSQGKDVDEGLFDRYPDLNAAAADTLGYSIRDRLRADQGTGPLDSPSNQAAAFVVNAMKYRARREDGLTPDIVMGRDLGEYNALEAAGVLDFGTGLRLVRLRAELAGDTDGAMAAVLGLTPEEIRAVLRSADLRDLVFTSLNTPYQSVLSGRPCDIARAEDILLRAGAYDVRPIAMGRPFHSPLLAAAAEKFRDALRGTTFEQPRIPVIANCTALPYRQESTAEILARHMREPVRWHESIRWAADRFPQAVYTAIGDQRLLLKMLRQIFAESIRSGPTGEASRSPVRIPSY
ncbi:ACP S-malonyltransferase [Kitasatospora herbaricolor]|uniref:ACP S-malonyltransferase n=1 Tax=Kitasatospora herbaricolor TaxID=68217 RepID=UPI0036DA6B27